MTGNDYNKVLAVTTAGYVIVEPMISRSDWLILVDSMAAGQLPHGIIIQKIAPRIWFPSMVVIWAILTVIHLFHISFVPLER